MAKMTKSVILDPCTRRSLSHLMKTIVLRYQTLMERFWRELQRHRLLALFHILQLSLFRLQVRRRTLGLAPQALMKPRDYEAARSSHTLVASKLELKLEAALKENALLKEKIMACLWSWRNIRLCRSIAPNVFVFKRFVPICPWSWRGIRL
ncbi:hypothetical protein FH972_025399 [Carpinus fangiana]|uniref:Uncharacterized protein n=1 Tax=Carpinus fangiana TaxID=176857 RepID=A0A5N6L1B4_9ROSI|nr:hypothetical protein FH972_025399 [Carpinus fangiana]